MSESTELHDKLAAAAARLARERNIWLATVRAGAAARPHLAPIWFVWLPEAERLYICTGEHSVKARNLAANPAVVAALEDGDHPLIVEGLARRAEPAAAVVAAFKAKYDWDITTDGDYGALFEIEPRKVLAWN
jgi:hypothetical protein